MQTIRQITLTPENDEYVSLLWKVSGMGSNDIINAAIDAKRKQDAALIEDIKALAERVKKHLSEEPEVEKHTIKELENTADILLGNKPYPVPIETPEQPKIRKKPGRKPKTLKEFVDGTAREVRQADKMSKDEFVEYFGGKG